MGKHMKAMAWQSRAELSGDVVAEETDALEAAMASGCRCLPNHCPALSSRRPRAPRIVRVWTDASPQADGSPGS